MHTRIAALCSAAVLVSAVSTTALAENAPLSRMNETTSSATTATPAPTGAAGGSSYGTAPSAPPAGTGSAAMSAPPASTYSAQNISDEKLQQFVASAQQVAVLSQQYTQRLQGTQDQTAQREVIAEANNRMEQVVRSNGLTVEEFNGIGDAVESDPQLTQRAQQMLQ